MPSNDADLNQQRDRIEQYAHRRAAGSPDYESTVADEQISTRSVQDSESVVDQIPGEAEATSQMNHAQQQANEPAPTLREIYWEQLRMSRNNAQSSGWADNAQSCNFCGRGIGTRPYNCIRARPPQ